MDTNSKAKTRKVALRSKVMTRRRLIQGGGIVKLNTDAVTAILQPIYNTLPSTKANGDHNLTYGEIEWSTLKYIVELSSKQQFAGNTPGKFYDLGCGRGRAVLYAALSGPFDQSVGIEILPERIALAQQALLKLKQSIPTAGAKVKLLETSFLNPALKYKDARAVFFSNLCIDDQTSMALFNKLNAEMQKGSLLFCSKAPSTKLVSFELLSVERMPMTWTPSSEFHVFRHL
jgi:SAM-dependent methyltransferase